MTMLICPECRDSISQEAGECPACGLTITPPLRRQMQEEVREQRRENDRRSAQMRREEEARVRQAEKETAAINLEAAARSAQQARIRAGIFAVLILATLVAVVMTWFN